MEHPLRHATQPRWRKFVAEHLRSDKRIPEEVTNFVPDDELVLDSKLFVVCLRNALRAVLLVLEVAQMKCHVAHCGMTGFRTCHSPGHHLSFLHVGQHDGFEGV